MTTQVLHPLAADYLERLRATARRLPRARRDELLAEIEVHLTEAIAPDATNAEALTALDRLGSPEEIVAAETPATPAGPLFSAIFLARRGKTPPALRPGS